MVILVNPDGSHIITMFLKDKEGPKAEGQRDTSQEEWLK